MEHSSTAAGLPTAQLSLAGACLPALKRASCQADPIAPLTTFFHISLP